MIPPDDLPLVSIIVAPQVPPHSSPPPPSGEGWGGGLGQDFRVAGLLQVK